MVCCGNPQKAQERRNRKMAARQAKMDRQEGNGNWQVGAAGQCQVPANVEDGSYWNQDAHCHKEGEMAENLEGILRRVDAYGNVGDGTKPGDIIKVEDQWFYSDKSRVRRGPFSTERMRKWWLKHKLPRALWVKPCYRSGFVVSANQGYAPIFAFWPGDELPNAFLEDEMWEQAFQEMVESGCVPPRSEGVATAANLQSTAQTLASMAPQSAAASPSSCYGESQIMTGVSVMKSNTPQSVQMRSEIAEAEAQKLESGLSSIPKSAASARMQQQQVLASSAPSKSSANVYGRSASRMSVQSQKSMMRSSFAAPAPVSQKSIPAPASVPAVEEETQVRSQIPLASMVEDSPRYSFQQEEGNTSPVSPVEQ